MFTTAAALVVGGLAIAFNQATDQPTDAVLFSGQDEFASVLKDASTFSLTTLGLLLVFKGAAWSISLGNFRGGPTFPGGASFHILAHARNRSNPTGAPNRTKRRQGASPAGASDDFATAQEKGP